MALLHSAALTKGTVPALSTFPCWEHCCLASCRHSTAQHTAVLPFLGDKRPQLNQSNQLVVPSSICSGAGAAGGEQPLA